MAPRVDHIGVIVSDLERAIEHLSQMLEGLMPQRRDLPEVGLRIAEFQTENLNIELIAYDATAYFAREVMGSGAGINHLSLQVKDIDGAIARLTGAGLRLRQGFPRHGAHGTVAFFDRDDATGLLLEICSQDGEP